MMRRDWFPLKSMRQNLRMENSREIRFGLNLLKGKSDLSDLILSSINIS